MRLFEYISSVVQWAYVTLARPDNGDYQTTQVSYQGRTTNAYVVTPYGLATNLPKDVLVLQFAVNNDEGNLAGIGCAVKDRFKDLKEGEVIAGSPKHKTFIKFDENGNITITATKDVSVDCSTCNINASTTNLGVGGNGIARIGDQIVVNVGGTDYTGQITTSGVNTSI